MSSSESSDEDESDESESDHGSETGPEFSYYMCLVCMGTARKPRVSFCGHVFCKACISKWMKKQKNPKCPYCQSRIGKRTIITVNQTDDLLYNSDGTLTNVPIAQHRDYCDLIETVIAPPEPCLIVGGTVQRPPELIPRHKPLDPQLLKGLRLEEEDPRIYFVASMWQRFIILLLMISIIYFSPIADTSDLDD